MNSPHPLEDEASGTHVSNIVDVNLLFIYGYFQFAANLICVVEIVLCVSIMVVRHLLRLEVLLGLLTLVWTRGLVSSDA